MTILQGTTSTGQIIPVQVDGQGRLVAQGLEGPPGPKGDCTALIGTDYVINRFAAHFTDPGSYPEYVLIGRFRPADQFRMIGTFQGARGSGGERNTLFSICCSSALYEATSVNFDAGYRLGGAGFNLVTLTWNGNPWAAISSSDPRNHGDIAMTYTGVSYHNYGNGSQWTHYDFGGYYSIPSSDVSNVVVLKAF